MKNIASKIDQRGGRSLRVFRSKLVLVAALRLVGSLSAQVNQRPATTVPDGETLKPGPGLVIPLADEIDLGDLHLRPKSLPSGLKLNAEFGLIMNTAMEVSRLHYQENVRADCARVIKTPGGDLLAVLAAGVGHYAPRGKPSVKNAAT
jgi:hypothetical protein